MKMRNKGKVNSIWSNAHLRHIAVAMVACSILYYAHVFVGLGGWTSIQIGLIRLHDFYGIDFYGLVFFGPVVYAAYVFGVRAALANALVSMLILSPYAIFTAPYPETLFRPAAFAIILSAVGATVAMLQKGDEERRRNMNELKCLYNVGGTAEESNSIEEFLSSVVALIPQATPSPSETKVRLVLRDKMFRSPDFEESSNQVKQNLVVGGEVLGSLEIFFRRPNLHLKQQYPFVRILAERISGAVRRIELEQSLKFYSEQLEEMVKSRTKDLEQAQGQLRLLSNTVKSSIDGITLSDMEGNLIFANEASQKMWGYTFDELTRMKVSELFSPSELGLVEKEIIPNSRDRVWNGELTAVRKDGSKFPILETTSPVRDENGCTVAIVGVHRDITETKSIRDKLIRSERLAAVGELASGVGHELRNPLNVIRNCVYLINMTLADGTDEDTRNTLRLLDQQVDISNKIVTDLLNFTRVRSPSLARVDFHTLVRQSLSWVVVPEEIAVAGDLTVFCG
jgi:PAS domain S-box-containing protein